MFAASCMQANPRPVAPRTWHYPGFEPESVPPPGCMYESRLHPLLPFRHFLRRWLRHALIAAALIVISLAIGIAGYAHYEHLGWVDGFLNSAMLLGGMGPVDPPKTEGGKLFAGFYALYAGLVFIAAMGIAFAPVVHRVLHRFHLESGK